VKTPLKPRFFSLSYPHSFNREVCAFSLSMRLLWKVTRFSTVYQEADFAGSPLFMVFGAGSEHLHIPYYYY